MKRRAVSAKLLDGHVLEVTRSDDSIICIDLAPYVNRGVFQPLQDVAFARLVAIDAVGGAEWPNGASLPPELLAADVPAGKQSNTPAVAR
jgi:hypothetical protein